MAAGGPRSAGNAGDDGSCRDVSGHDRSGTDKRVLADCPADDPIAVRLKHALIGRGARVLVVREHHTVTDEDLVADLDSGTDERVTRDLATSADDGAALDLDERADPRSV